MNTEIIQLKNLILYLKSNLDIKYLQELSNKCNSVNNYCKNDGAGLLGGCLIDMLISKFFENKLKEYKEYREGEADMMLCNIPLSLKKINGKSTIALNWSKNKNDIGKEYFKDHIIIMNLKTEQWWKKNPKKSADNKIIYNDTINAGIYIIDKNYCKSNIKLTSNNKSNSIIESKSIYEMIKNSINEKLYIELPEPNKNISFNILNAFLE